ncbi:hypothetical protein [Solimonas terrae]|uniref:Uncharacterized protein n=1 Tax=Solimonas terrae TaxID=1396819 RepID=A0A6M2BN90_9GAMM|nr:hypothetical protein [Solimonas terrae]NGY04122.1 hypothetical protein [Solimonas terrae]
MSMPEQEFVFAVRGSAPSGTPADVTAAMCGRGLDRRDPATSCEAAVAPTFATLRPATSRADRESGPRQNVAQTAARPQRA